MNNALIIFVRNPELGKVKTRLAMELGDERALEIYGSLLEHTRETAQKVNCKRFVYYSNHIPIADEWHRDEFEKRLQSQSQNLGDRMLQAFEEVFATDAEKVAIIGSDCFELTPAIIEEGLAALHTHDVVIGPAVDGGYYLLGMKKPLPMLFKNKIWGTSSVFKETMDDLTALGLLVYQLPRLNDVDNVKDLPDFFALN